MVVLRSGLFDIWWLSRPGLSLRRLRGPMPLYVRFRRDSKMNLGKEEEKEREGGDEDEVAGGGVLPASPECLLRRCLLFEPLWGAVCLPGPLYQ